MKNLLALHCLALCALLLSTTSFAAQRVNKPSAAIQQGDIQKISVDSEYIFLMKNALKFFWVQCDPECTDYIQGVREIGLGDTLSFKSTKITIGAITRIKHPPTVSTIANQMPSENFSKSGSVSPSMSDDRVVATRIHPHSADCILAANADELPTGGKCDNRWILIEGCEVIK